MLGYGDEEIEPLTDWQQLVHPDDLERVRTALRDHLAGQEPMFESVHRLRHRDGVWLWVVSRAKARVDEQGRARRIVGVDLDVTERKLFEEALFKEKESAQITLQSIGDGVITTDSKCRIEYLNPVAEQLTGWRLEHAQGRIVDEIFRSFHEETCEPLENPLAVAIRRTRAIKSVRPTLLIRRDGNELYIESCASPIRDGAGNVLGGVLVFHDVSESRELNRKLSYHASHDILTGLVNRREFESRLERAIKSARAREASFALCHIDLDQFKIINDNCGHSAGDALLGQVGALLKSKIRWRDTVSRLGGDEFGVLLESCSLEEAVRNAEVAARGDPQLQVRVGRAHVPARREHRRRADVAGERGRRRAAVRGGQRLRCRQGERPQPHLQLPGKRHRPDAPPARDAMGGAHQQRARRRPVRNLPPVHPAAAEPAAARAALRAAAAHARRGGQDRHAGPVHRGGRALSA